MTRIFTGSGSYIPSLVAVTNVSSMSVPYDGDVNWTQVGNVVTVNGILSVTPTLAASTDTQVDMSLPVPPAAGQAGRLGGSGSAISLIGSAPVAMSKSGSLARFRFLSVSTGALEVSFSLSYRAA